MNSRWMVATLLVAVASGGHSVDAAGLMHFSVTQVRQLDVGAPVVRAYLDLTDAQGEPLATLPASSLSATLGEWSTEPVNVTPFTAMRQGIAYVFLVDISKSLSPELFQRMVGGIETWVQDMGLTDRAALISFGETSQLIVDFTGDKNELLAGLATLGPTDDETLLHQALADAMELSRRLDADLPGRRALVIFSDGKDEGSAFEAEDILAKLRDNPSPIYSIGYSRLRDPAERKSYLNLMQRFSTNSGGVFFAAEETRFAEAYDSIRHAIRRVWVTDFLCTECRADGGLHRLQVQVSLDEKVLSSGGSVRLLPLINPEAPDVAEVAEVEEEPTPDRTAPPQSRAPSQPGSSFSLRPWLIGLAVMLAALIIWLVRSRGQTRQPGRPQAEFYPSPPPFPIDPKSEPEILDPPRPIPMSKQQAVRQASPAPTPPPRRRKGPSMQVRLIVVRGSRIGRQYSFVVGDRAVVGRRSSCDCVLAEESGIDAIQFELIHENGELFLENLSDRLPTQVDNQPLTGRYRLSSDTLMGTGETVLRIVFH